MWDVLLPTEQQAKGLIGGLLNTKNISQQIEYMDTRRTRNTLGRVRVRITLHGVPVDICEDRIGDFFSKYDQVVDINALISKSGITTVYIELQVPMNHKSVGVIPNILVCQEKRTFVVMEERTLCCWLCGASGLMAKECPAKCTQTPTCPTTTAADVAVPLEESVTETPHPEGSLEGGP